jgi:predicted dehydrogenase
MEPRALLIGCGNIGAGYDFDTAEVRTHAKAYSRMGIPVDTIDLDPERATRVAERYGGQAYGQLAAVDLGRYRSVSLCSDTGTHAGYLRALLAAKVPLVFAEKPVAAAATDLTELRALYAGARSVVVVNYMRRFLPAYHRLRQHIRAWNVPLLNVLVRYHRGFLNNAGHALDLLEFLLDRPLELEGFTVSDARSDAFANDPTLTATFKIGEAPAVLLGFPGSGYAIFDVELGFLDRRVHIADMGDRIAYYLKDGERTLRFDETLSESDCLRDYMLPVFETGFRLLDEGRRAETNFDAAAALNLRMVTAAGRP